MPSVYDLKPRLQNLVRPAMERLAAVGVTPNGVTLAAVFGSFLIGGLLLLARHHPVFLLLLPGWLFTRMALNAIDGMMAREKGMASPLGAVLNELGDVLSDLALYTPLAFLVPAATWPVLCFSLAAVLTEFCGVLGAALGGGRQYGGPMGKSDRAFLVGALGTVTALAPAVFQVWPWFFGAAAGLALLTCLNRIRATLAALRIEAENR